MTLSLETQTQCCTNFVDLQKLLSTDLKIIIDGYGLETIIVNNIQEDFELDDLSKKIGKLSSQMIYSPKEILAGRAVCRITKQLYRQLEKEYGKLGCLAAFIYRWYHGDRKIPLHDDSDWQNYFHGKDFIFRKSEEVFLTEKLLDITANPF